MKGHAGCALVMIALVLASCATQPTPAAFDSPGFFSGLLHGLTAEFALFASLIWDVRVYAFPNSGWWYDLGFMLGFGTSGFATLIAAAASIE
nr:hypothetical protein DBT41_14900 [Aerococcus urinae]